jgi:hypothetical protein
MNETSIKPGSAPVAPSPGSARTPFLKNRDYATFDVGSLALITVGAALPCSIAQP